MTHNHSHDPVNYNRVFIISATLNISFVIIEAVSGILANSLALLADAGHNLSDVLGLLLAWGASILVRRSDSPTHLWTTTLFDFGGAAQRYLSPGCFWWNRLGSHSTVSSTYFSSRRNNNCSCSGGNCNHHRKCFDVPVRS